MADMTIDDATADMQITGVEKLPASDGGTAKSVTVWQIRDFVVAELADADAADDVDVAEDGIFVSVDGEVKTLPAEKLAKAVINYACALTGIVGPNGNEIFIIDDSGTKKTITLAQITSYITANGSAFFDSLTSASVPLAASDLLIVKQSGVAKKCQLSNFAAYALSTFASFLTDCVPVLNVQNTDKIAVVSGGITKYMTVAQLSSALAAGVTVPDTTTTDNIPQWSNAEGDLKNGLAVGTTVRNAETADNSTIPTEAAVRTAIANAIDGVDADGVTGPSTTTAGKIPQWDSTSKKLTNGLTLSSSISDSPSNDKLPTEKAVKDAIDAEATARGTAITNAVSDEATARGTAITNATQGMVTGPSSTTAGKIPTWDSTQKKLTDGKTLTTEVGQTGLDSAIPTEKAVRTAIAAEATARGTAINNAVSDKVIAPSSTTTQGNIPTWDSMQNKLTTGKTVVQSVDDIGSNDNIPTEKAVRTAIAAATTNIGTGDVTGPLTTTEGRVPQWDATTKRLKNGLPLVLSSTGIANATNASDSKLPTEAAVRAVVDAEATARETAITTATTNMVEKSGSVTNTHLATWDASGKLVDGKAVTTTIADTGALDSNIPTEKAVRTAIAAEATARDTAISNAVSGLGTGDVQKSGNPSSGSIAEWTVYGKIEGGHTVTEFVGPTGTNTAVPTEKAVRTAIANATADVVTKSGTPTAGNLSKFLNSSTVVEGPGITTSVGTIGSNSDVPTEMAVRSAISDAITDALETAAADATTKANAAAETVASKISAPVSHTVDYIPQWGTANELKAGKNVVTTLADNASNDNIPTEKAVRDALPVPATNAADGLMSAADKAKLDNLVDTTAVEEIGDTGLADSDVLTVLKNGTTWKKVLITRLWTWLMGKLTTFKLDAFAVPDDNPNLNASASAHGLCPKLSGNTDEFLRGDGTFAEPSGTTDFTGDSGSGGTHGLVPAPASGDTAANKFLCANGTWVVPPSASGVDIPGSQTIGAPASADLLYCYDDSEGAFRKVSFSQLAAFVMGVKRYDNIFIPSGAMVPSATNGATPGALTFTNVKRDTLAFSNTTGQGAEFSVVMPEDWDGDTVRAKLMWTAYDVKAEHGEMVAWKIGAVSTPDEGAITVAPMNYATVTDNLSQVNELHRTGATGQITAEGTRGAGNLVHFVVKRDPTAETANPMDTDALLLGVWLQYGRTSNVTEEWS